SCVPTRTRTRDPATIRTRGLRVIARTAQRPPPVSSSTGGSNTTPGPGCWARASRDLVGRAGALRSRTTAIAWLLRHLLLPFVLSLRDDAPPGDPLPAVSLLPWQTWPLKPDSCQRSPCSLAAVRLAQPTYPLGDMHQRSHRTTTNSCQPVVYRGER